MIIGIDIRVLMDEHYSGISEYTARLLAELLRQDNSSRYRLFYNSFRPLESRMNFWQRDNSSLHGTRWPNKIFNYFFQRTLGRPRLDKILGGADLFWSPHFNFSRLSRGHNSPRHVLTVHDLSFLRYPQFFSLRKNIWHSALDVKRQIREADIVVAASESTKDDILELAGAPTEKVRVIYAGNNRSAAEITPSELAAFQAEKGISGRVILYLGTIEPRKNLAGLIQAFESLRADKSIPGREQLRLVLAGAPGWRNGDIYRAWRQSPCRDDILFTGYVSEREKDCLYRLASLFVYPSYYEGFGFPPLEAMARGVPVITSNISSLPEVAGGAALLINPFKIEEIKAAMAAILGEEKLRQRLVAAGYERAAAFDWSATAQAYLSLFKELCEQ